MRRKSKRLSPAERLLEMIFTEPKLSDTESSRRMLKVLAPILDIDTERHDIPIERLCTDCFKAVVQAQELYRKEILEA